MSLRHKKQIIKDRSGDGGLTIHYMNRDEFELAYQQSALDCTTQETTIKEQKELIATLQKSLEDKTKELKIARASSLEANDHRALCAAQVIQLEKDKDELKRDITALEDSHKSEVEALQQEAKANADTAQKKAVDELEELRTSYIQMKTNLEQQMYDLEQQNDILNEQAQTLQEEAQVASESIKSLQQSNKTFEQSNKNLEESNNKLQQSHTTLGQYIQGQNTEIQTKTNALAKSKIEYVQLSREHKKLQETLESATDMINTRTSRITQLEKQYIERGEALIATTEKIRTLEQQYKEQQESSASKYNTLEKEYKLLENDNKVKYDEVQSLKKEVCEFKTRIDLKMKVLLEKSRSTSQQYENQLTEMNHSVANLEREKQAKDLEVERMKAQVKELTEDNQSQVKINTSLQSQLDGASDCYITNPSNNNNESSKTTSGDDIVELKSSKGDEGSVDIKTKAFKSDSSASTPVQQSNTTLRSSLSNALSDIGNRQGVNSTNGTTTKQKKATDLKKSQASTTNSSNKASVVQQLLLPDENSTVTSPATSELFSDHFDTNSEPKQDQNETSDSTLDKQVPCSSSCNDLNQGESKVIHPRRQKRQSLEEYVQSLGNNNNHQAKSKEGNTDASNPRKSLEVELNKTTTTETTEVIPELDIQGKRKRKSVDLYIPERIRPKKKKKSVESAAADNTENKENVDDEGIEIGEVGYTFKKWFKAPYNDWYDGEVVELVEINGTIYRRCSYADGDVEDYTIEHMAKFCKPRSWTWHNKR